MSPLVSLPARGYPDWQRIDNYDTGVLAALTLAGVGPVTSGVLDVSRFACLSAVCTPAVGSDVVFSAQWWADVAATIPMGSRNIVFGSGINHAATFIIPNLGPFVTTSLLGAGGVAANGSCDVIATNRQHTNETISASPLPISRQPILVGAGAAVDVFPLDYCSGAMQMWLTADQLAVVEIRAFDTNNADTPVFVFDQVAANTNFRATFVAPTGLWYLFLQNLGGVTAHFFVTVIQSPTGST